MPSRTPVILVDDDRDDLDILTEIIHQIDPVQDILAFQQGDEVLSYLKTTKDNPLIIISDINMPGMSGISLRTNIFNDVELRSRSIPFVFYSTHAEKNAVKEAYQLAVQGFFKKGETVEDIEVVLREMFSYWKRCVHPNWFKDGRNHV